MALRARVTRLAGGLAVAGALVLAAPATALAQEVTPGPPAPAQSLPAQATPAPLPPAPLPPAPPTARATRPAPPAVETAQPTPAEAPGRPGQPGQVSRVPVGAPETGGGATAPGPDAAPFVLGGLALLGAAGAATAVTVRRRRGSAQG